jgi:hypothetical protein
VLIWPRGNYVIRDSQMNSEPLPRSGLTPVRVIEPIGVRMRLTSTRVGANAVQLLGPGGSATLRPFSGGQRRAQPARRVAHQRRVGRADTVQLMTENPLLAAARWNSGPLMPNTPSAELFALEPHISSCHWNSTDVAGIGLSSHSGTFNENGFYCYT